MNLNRSRKGIMALAALLIILFHQWIAVIPRGTFFGGIERFIVQTGYVGVDMFFFLSAYSMARTEVTNYPRFILERAVKILPLFAVAYLLGEFLWFLPSLMVFYLVAPPCLRFCKGKNPHLMLALFLALWAVFIYLTEGVFTIKQDLGIFSFRIPVFILGAYFSRLEGKWSIRTRLLAGIPLLVIGLYVLDRYGYMKKLTVPYTDTFYLCAIPCALGLILLLDVLQERGCPKPIAWFGGITLELYFMQFVLGGPTVYRLLKLTHNNKLLTSLAALAIVITASWLLSLALKPFNKFCRKQIGKVFSKQAA